MIVKYHIVDVITEKPVFVAVAFIAIMYSSIGDDAGKIGVWCSIM